MKNILIIKHISLEGPGTLGEYLDKNGISTYSVDLSGGDILPDFPQDYVGVVILGGPMNVYEEDKFPFLKDEQRFIQTVLSAEIPLLGICLGAQLIAKAAGARVYKAKSKEIGWYRLKLTPEGATDPLFKGFTDEFFVFQWHGDTFDVPESGKLLATSDGCPNQAFRYGKCAYGLQFHLEVTSSMIREWISAYDSEIEELAGSGIINPQQILQNSTGLIDDYNTNARHLFSNFFGSGR
jgi:GMP synthase-like glutamine amidotransferase